MKDWQLQEAKARLSELVKFAAVEGPQHITVHGRRLVVVISEKEYDELTKPKVSFVQFVLNSPLVNTKLDIERDKSLTRDVEL